VYQKGSSMKIADSYHMRELDRMTIEDTGIPGEVLMENAGQAVFRTLSEEIEDLHHHRIVILCGPGNNGGDGFVTARYLANNACEPTVILAGEHTGLRGACRIHADAAVNTGIRVHEIHDTTLQVAQEWIHDADIIIDALFGTGVNRPLDGPFLSLVSAVNDSDAYVVSVDIPSGMSADTGQLIGPCIHADQTVTFGLPKPALILYPPAACAGRISVADISIPVSNIQKMNLPGDILTPDHFPVFFAPREPDTHKGRLGHLLIIAGSPGKTGAAILSARAAARAGAGLVTVAIPQPLNGILESNLIEVMTLPMPGTASHFTPEHVKTIHDALSGKTAVLAGPGIGTHPETAEFLRCLCPGIRQPLILDADALNCIAADPEPFFPTGQARVLTPHPGEFSRLTGLPVEDIFRKQIETVTGYASGKKSIVVFKTARTIIASPDNTYRINITGNPGLASGGSGDVLAGLISGLAAQNIDLIQAAGAGVFWHGLTADITAALHGENEMLAGDLPGHLAEAREIIAHHKELFNGRHIPYSYLPLHGKSEKVSF
jgi:ADP-dependent NAD(P)H-hydrate dehydratase / NAD(P)H-hydrate epimerase